MTVTYLAVISFSLTDAKELPPADVLDPTKYSRWAAKYFSTNGRTTCKTWTQNFKLYKVG